ncbi:MAG: type II toxin-antitoxin system PemK/MazF family toxin [Bryobacteraceae bacterium]
MTFPRRGDIYLIDFDSSRGHKTQKPRPAVIIQNDVSNQYSPITIVAAISSHFADPPRPRRGPRGTGREYRIDPTLRRDPEPGPLH